MSKSIEERIAVMETEHKHMRQEIHAMNTSVQHLAEEVNTMNQSLQKYRGAWGAVIMIAAAVYASLRLAMSYFKG